MKGATILFIYIKSIESTSFKGIIVRYLVPSINFLCS